MSTAQAPTVVTGVDFVSVPTQDLERAVAFYGETLGLRARCTARAQLRRVRDRHRHAERRRSGAHGHRLIQPNANHIALHVEDVAAARATLEERGIAFTGDTIDTACATWRSSPTPMATR